MICPKCRRSFRGAGATGLPLLFCTDDGTPLVTTSGTISIKESPTHPTRETGAIVEGRYVIRGLLGKGGMARVYLAEDARTQGRVALKVLRREQAGNAVSRERFLREVDVAATLVHPNIARILDAGERPDGCPFLVLELLLGEALGELLAREGALPVDWALELTRDAASALVAAHKADVVHRDVKPDNLFVTVDGQLKVVDFGFAKLKEGGVTEGGTTLGTVSYMAPEQALADPVDGRTDVYGLGVTLFHMLTGTLPFSGSNDARVVARHLHAPAPTPSSRRKGLDPRIDQVVLAAMRKHPDHRYQTMAAMQEDLERLLHVREGEITVPEGTGPDEYQAKTATARSVARHLRALVDDAGLTVPPAKP